MTHLHSYASTRASLTRSLGESSFVDSLHAHSTSDLTSAAYRNHLKHSNSSAPLTERERELADLKAAEGVEARGTAPRGGAFSTNEEKGVLRWSEEAQQAARELAETQDGAVHLVHSELTLVDCTTDRAQILDIAAETVTLSSRQTGASLAIPTDSPSYSLIAHAGKFGAPSSRIEAKARI